MGADFFVDVLGAMPTFLCGTIYFRLGFGEILESDDNKDESELTSANMAGVRGGRPRFFGVLVLL